MKSTLQSAHRFSSNHREHLKKDNRCGCFYCLEVYHPTEIVEWIDDEDTAICPKCGTDAVIGESSGLSITPLFLKEMKNYWF
ncbi:cytoplasmic protein [Sutcliffiella rhizosphaerae]|uniref:cytoplasmic protein n=1 Tax=Sutcliffiella rhizosphaerae TaxID=2880967 RepID=UPI001E5DD091|nr:cytoplasmic protein [Sutcliffiella rhizosphaerae]